MIYSDDCIGETIQEYFEKLFDIPLIFAKDRKSDDEISDLVL